MAVLFTYGIIFWIATRMLVHAVPMKKPLLSRKMRATRPVEQPTKEHAMRFLRDLAGGGDGCGLKLGALADFSAGSAALISSPLHRSGLPSDFCGVPEQVSATEKYLTIANAMRSVASAGKDSDDKTKDLSKQIDLLRRAAQHGGNDRLLCTSGNDRLIQQRLVEFLSSQRQGVALDHRGALDATVPRGAVAPIAAPGGFPLQQMVWNALPDLQKAFKANNKLVYIENVFPPEIHERLLKERDRLWKGGASLVEPSCSLDGNNRMGGYVRPSAQSSSSCVNTLEQLYEAIYGNPEFQKLVSLLTGHDVYPSDLPIEMRRYGEESDGMAWHNDIVMYEDAASDYEIVYTLDNHGKSRTDFIDASGQLQRQHSKANSLFVVQAAAARHMVSPSEGGRRDILKAIYSGTLKKTDRFWEWGTNDCSSDHPNRVAPWTKGM